MQFEIAYSEMSATVDRKGSNEGEEQAEITRNAEITGFGQFANR